ncbi:TPA: recombinase family protein [Klebsiella pneumoniae]|nr:recombinase family protein [Klebsiella pneumoniae]HBV0705904.1 recombinase family protein [Klebsiella pneumoniae]
MSRIFAYCRVSTLEQNTENQRREIETVGFAVKFQRLIEEHISGSVAASERPGFTCLLDRMENGGSGIRFYCLPLGGVDLTSAAGKMAMQVISAVAGFEKDLLIERTHSGIVRARASGKRSGRPSSLNGEQQQVVLERFNSGVSISAIAREFSRSFFV